MKLIITKPKDTCSCIWAKSLFETWLWYNDISTGGKMKFSWNDCYEFYDVWFVSATKQPDLDIDTIVDFLAEQGLTINIASKEFEYKNNIKSDLPISARVWIYPKGD